VSLKIFHITGNTAYGGTTFYSKSLVEKAIQDGCEVHYETSQAEVVEEYKDLPAKIVSIPELDRPLHPIKDFITIFKLYRYIKKEKFDIVHSHTSKGGFVGRIAARLAGAKAVVHTVQGFAFHEHSGILATFFYKTLEQFAGLFCNAMIFVNTHDLDFAIEKNIIPKEKTNLIYNGVAPKKVQVSEEERQVARQQIREEFALPQDAFIVGSIARLSPQKGISYLIDAIPPLFAKYENLYFLVVGTGILEKELHEQAKKLNIGERLIFAGYRTDNTRLLNSLDVYILPSLWEGFSLSLLEAMAVELPIVTTSIKGNREAINSSCGISISPKSPKEIETAIAKYLDDPTFRKNMAASAKQKFMEEHTPEHMLQQTDELYNRLLKRKKHLV